MIDTDPSDTSSMIIAKQADSIVTVLKDYIKNGGRGFKITNDSYIYEFTKAYDIWRFTKTKTGVIQSYTVLVAQIEFEA